MAHKKKVIIPGPVGELEAVLHMLDKDVESRFGVICHPNPLEQGTMDNKVVTTLARTMNDLDVPCVRFNYRGVGNSTGTYGNLFGEVDDCLHVINWVHASWPAQIWLAGFSFGSIVAMLAASKVPAEHLISIAPAIGKYDLTNFNLEDIQCPWLICMGDQDEIVSSTEVYAWYDNLQANKSLIRFANGGHFFHGLLIDLRNRIKEHYINQEYV